MLSYYFIPCLPTENFGINEGGFYLGDLRKFVEHNKIDFLVYRIANYEHAERLDDYLGVHVIRNPRDVLVSSYFSHLQTHRFLVLEGKTHCNSPFLFHLTVFILKLYSVLYCQMIFRKKLVVDNLDKRISAAITAKDKPVIGTTTLLRKSLRNSNIAIIPS